jgi:hypothetical protein
MYAEGKRNQEIDKFDGWKYSRISSITSTYGSGAILVPGSNSIGKVLKIDLQDIGFDYSSDFSVRPISKFPSILVLDPLASFDYIGITSIGKNYSIAPSLVVIDGLTNEVIKDLDLSYNLGDPKVTIKKNSTSISNTKPKIIPTNAPPNTNVINERKAMK